MMLISTWIEGKSIKKSYLLLLQSSSGKSFLFFEKKAKRASENTVCTTEENNLSAILLHTWGKHRWRIKSLQTKKQKQAEETSKT